MESIVYLLWVRAFDYEHGPDFFGKTKKVSS